MNSTYSHNIFIKKKSPTPSIAFKTYWKFACLRQEAFYNRIESPQGVWSEDKIINTYKFTNAYRASDRVSQFLIKDVIYSSNWDVENTLFRILLFKIFNKIETWKLLESQFDEISLKTFNVKSYGKVLQQAMDNKKSIYSAAYIIPSGSKEKYKGKRKHEFHLTLLSELFNNNFVEDIVLSKSMNEAYNRVLNIESFGKFLAYQFTTDFNYSSYLTFGEDEFVVPGPGAQDGIRKCFKDLGDYNESEVIKFMMENQDKYFDKFELDFQNLWGRPLQLIDCQNLFCEVDKYSRVAHPNISGISGRTRIKQKFNPKKSEINFWYPPKWGINDAITEKNIFMGVALI